LTLSGHGESSVELRLSDDLKPDGRERFLSERQWLSEWIIMQKNKLFVGNLSFDVTENDLQDTFAQYGAVTEVNLMMDRSTGRSRGFAFVTMATDEAAQAAIAALNGADLRGRALTVNVARPRTEGGGGGGRGGRGGGYGRRY
jgi:RNA recognition motif-containing protein